ncbi:MAG: hypothetical protein WC169_12390 [Dehalococcoidia bacterium]|jgi:hypothetical protein
MNWRDLQDIFLNEGLLKKAKLYLAQEVETDPTEHTTTKTFLNPITIKAVILSISFSGLKYKYFGTLPSGSKQMICDIKYKNLILKSDKIEIDDETFGIYSDGDGNFQYIERNDYLLVILKIKA